MPIDPQIKRITMYSAASIAANLTTVMGAFQNPITIRRFIETCGGQSGTSPTTALNIDDAGAAGGGSTAIADKSAAALTNEVPVKTEANDVNAADGYKLAAGNAVKVAIAIGGSSTPTFTGYTLVMEYVEGIG